MKFIVDFYFGVLWDIRGWGAGVKMMGNLYLNQRMVIGINFLGVSLSFQIKLKKSIEKAKHYSISSISVI
jgi:hypothetical protein